MRPLRHGKRRLPAHGRRVCDTDHGAEGDVYKRQEYENRTIEDTLLLGWELLTIVPVRELKRVRDEYIEKYLKPLVAAQEDLEQLAKP